MSYDLGKHRMRGGGTAEVDAVVNNAYPFVLQGYASAGHVRFACAWTKAGEAFNGPEYDLVERV